MALLQKTTSNWLFILFTVLFCSNFVLGQFPNDHDIYKVDVNTGIVSRITSIPNAGEFNPAWSNNGKLIAHDVVGGPAPLGHAIYITNVNTGTSTLLVGAEGGNDAAWSKNGKKIAFDLSQVGNPSIFVISPTGGTPQLVAEDATDPDWSQNSKRLVFHRPSDGSIRTIKENGSSEAYVADGITPAWSPDGKYIAFSYLDDIWTIPVNNSGVPTGVPNQITINPAMESHPDWSNDGETIVFHSNRDGDFDIWIIPALGGTATKLTGLVIEGDFDPAFSKNGKYVAYAGFTPQVPSFTPPAVGPIDLPETPNIRGIKNYPNPFNPNTTIIYELNNNSFVSVEVYDISGNLISTLINAEQTQGIHSVRWEGSSDNGIKVPAGIYIGKISSGKDVSTMKLMLLK